MASPKKTVSLNIFHILKSVVDKKEKDLITVVQIADDAKHEQELMQDHIKHLQTYAAMNRCSDPRDAYDAEGLVETYEYQLKGISKKIARGDKAREDLAFVPQFNKTYQFACGQAAIQQELNELMKQRAKTESQLERIEKNIETCEINQSDRVYGANVKAQAKTDIEFWNDEYARVSRELAQINQSIANLHSR